MRKSESVLRTPLLCILLILFVGASLNSVADAKSRRGASRKKGSEAKTASTRKGKGAKAKAASTRKKGGKAAAAAEERGGRRSRKGGKKGAAEVDAKQGEALLRKRGKLTRAEQRMLAGYKSSRKRRARAIYLARMRALRARDEALRNIASNNIAKDQTAGEDPDIRAAAVTALQGRSGTVVVMDPNTGRVFTVVNQQMALGSPVKPCSTVKLIVGLASLHEGVFDPNQDVQVSARLGMNLTDALAHSNNPVFQVLGRLLGYERVTRYAANFGFGQRTGINYPGESDGFLPEEGDQETGHMSSHGDGFGVTAIQLAAFTGAIANGGSLYTPRVPRTPEEAQFFQPVLKRRIEMTPEDRLRMMAGMSGAVNYGTGKLAYNPLAQVAGKTGTCTGSQDKLGLFTSFSGVDSPRVVVTVITTGSTEAGKRAAEIAGRVYSAISPRFFRDRLAPQIGAGTEIQLNRTNDTPQ